MKTHSMWFRLAKVNEFLQGCPPYDAALLWAFYTEKGLTNMVGNPFNEKSLRYSGGRNQNVHAEKYQFSTCPLNPTSTKTYVRI
jgi:hypothetical protein